MAVSTISTDLSVSFVFPIDGKRKKANGILLRLSGW